MIAGLVLAALVASAAAALPLKRTGAVLLAGVSVLWFLVNAPMEGEVLLFLTPAHGLSAADLAGIAGLGIALVAWLLADD
ncbi:hypothetical protein FB382_000140 [Nocardioides ginsengisegetis]|uniref:Uncharacterized protein n=1 Tax=Nocardioides ginsengisegetis TaxID=661491 RepID=A0A7W3IWM8_9ACTN|nr:hypothetical protein [Nocardioides ginsengisegetis]MBA8801849.1 hypothetical protein [Nocardioides ginsengisegetis]